IHNATGLHARPAKVFVNTAKQFKADIRVQHGDKRANGKSLISVLTLGVERGQQISLFIEGEDEDEAAAALAAIVAAGLGEGAAEPMPAAVAAPAAAPVATPTAAPGMAPAAAPANVMRGVPAAPGIAIGPLFRLRNTAEVPTGLLSAVVGTDDAEEAQRLQTAIAQAKDQLVALRRQLVQRGAAAEAAIFDVHLEILEDEDLLSAVGDRIRRGEAAAHAWQSVITERARAVAALDDPLLAGRAADLHDVGYRVLQLLVGVGESGLRLPDHPVILVAQDLTPSETANLDPNRVLGFCTAAGGPTAHAAIIARALSLPAVVSMGAGVLDLADGTLAVLDGQNGVLVVAPDAVTLTQAQQRRERWLAARLASEQTATEPAITTDGVRIEVVANIGGVAEAERAVQAGAEGVGLLRTEFLFLDRSDPPDEEEQFRVYRDIVQAMQGRPVIVRTLDIGGDKPLPYIRVPAEANPFLGERGIRLCLARPDLLRQQVRAILRASTYGPLRIMFPMVADWNEWQRARQMVLETARELGVPPVPLGIMVEVPAAALLADVFAREVDFFSVGTNDLTQYTLAVDRQHPSLAGMSDGLHPSVLRLIAHTIEAAHAAGKWVGICGELAADPQAIPILVGLGADELSVGVPAIPTVKAQVRTFSRAEAEQRARQALRCATAAEVRALVPVA
ncbi:MAG: phosphoenolpyruvate--protein phosphotransferase, partial [Anaerolineae bacterium]|nr:phosphoenolpyruvate--protein phosphotransferase [Anaerolineae bacterium]